MPTKMLVPIPSVGPDAKLRLVALRGADLASGVLPVVTDAFFERLRASSPFRQLMQREVRRALAQQEEDRRRARRRRVGLSLAVGALAVAAAGGSRLRRSD